MIKRRLNLCLTLGDLYEACKIRDELGALSKKNVRASTQIEALRRAERVVGQLVRRGQTGPDKYIRKYGDGSVKEDMISPEQFFIGTKERKGAYAMADASDEDFEAALAKGWEKKSLARERIAAYAEKMNPKEDPRHRRPEVLKRTKRINVQRVLAETMATLEGVSMGIAVLEDEDFESLNPQEAHRLYNEMGAYIGTLRKFRGRLKQ